MERPTYIYAGLLIVLGVGAYIATSMASLTALIPAFFGIVVLVFALIARNEKFHMHAMHVIVLLALVGIVMTWKGIPASISVIRGEEIARPEAALTKALMCLLSVRYFIQCIGWFRNNRRLKKEAQAAEAGAEN